MKPKPIKLQKPNKEETTTERGDPLFAAKYIFEFCGMGLLPIVLHTHCATREASGE